MTFETHPPLIEGAGEYAASRGAPAVEAYPVNPPGRVDTTMASSAREMSDKAGFRLVRTRKALARQMPRIVMPRDAAASRSRDDPPRPRRRHRRCP